MPKKNGQRSETVTKKKKKAEARKPRGSDDIVIEFGDGFKIRMKSETVKTLVDEFVKKAVPLVRDTVNVVRNTLKPMNDDELMKGLQQMKRNEKKKDDEKKEGSA